MPRVLGGSWLRLTVQGVGSGFGIQGLGFKFSLRTEGSGLLFSVYGSGCRVRIWDLRFRV